MYVKTFKTDAIVFICIKRHDFTFTDIFQYQLILTISLRSKKKCPTNFKKPAQIHFHSKTLQTSETWTVQ